MSSVQAGVSVLGFRQVYADHEHLGGLFEARVQLGPRDVHAKVSVVCHGVDVAFEARRQRGRSLARCGAELEAKRPQRSERASHVGFRTRRHEPLGERQLRGAQRLLVAITEVLAMVGVRQSNV